MTRLTVWEQLQLHAPHQVERLQVAEISEAFGHHISKIRNKENKRCNKMCLTFWKRADGFAEGHVEVRQVDQKPEAFGHHISKIRKQKM